MVWHWDKNRKERDKKIIQLLRDGVTKRNVAERFGLTKSAISTIWDRKKGAVHTHEGY